jgi:hypothetical protein
MRPATAWLGYLRMMTRVAHAIMITTFSRRKIWLRPVGTASRVSYLHSLYSKAQLIIKLTFPIIVQVQELVAPLCQNSKSVLEKGNNDQKSANGWEVSAKVMLISL